MSKRFEFDVTKGITALIYGQPGSGKTRLSASAALDPKDRWGKVLMLEAFGNPMSIRDYDRKPDIVTIEDMEDFNEPYEWLTGGQPEEHPFCKDFNLTPPYKTVIVDGLTEVQRFVIRKVSGVDFTGPGDLTPLLGRQGFGQLLGTMLNWATHFVKLADLGLNVILTSLEASSEEAGVAKSKPLFWGQSGGEICGYVLLVIRLTTQLAAPKSLMTHPNDPVYPDSNNVAFFRETTTHYAKDQYYIGIDHLVDPTMANLMDLLERSNN